METIIDTDYVWMQNPDGRKIEAHKSIVKELLERGFRMLDDEQAPLPDMEKDVLEVIEV